MPSCVTTSGEQRQRRVEKRCRAIDHRPHGCVDRAEQGRGGDKRAEPVREVDDFRRGDARKQILRASRKPGDFVRKDRSADEHMIVFGGPPVQRHGYVLMQAPARDVGDVARGDGPEKRERGRIVPPMVEDVAGPRAAVDDGPANERAELRIVHRRVRSQRNKIVERRDPPAQLPLEQLEHQRHRHRARAVGNDHEHPAAVYGQRRQPLARNGSDLLWRQVALVYALSNRHQPKIIVKNGWQ